MVPGDERGWLERPCRYLPRPPLSSERLIATVTDPGVVRKILTCIGLPARPPPIAPASESERAELGFDA